MEANTISQPLMANLRVYTGTFIPMTVTNHPSTWQNDTKCLILTLIWVGLTQSPAIFCGFLWSQQKSPMTQQQKRIERTTIPLVEPSSWQIWIKLHYLPKDLAEKEHMFETTTESLRDSRCFQCRYSNAQQFITLDGACWKTIVTT